MTRRAMLALTALALLAARDVHIKAMVESFWTGLWDLPAERPDGSTLVGGTADNGLGVYFALPGAALKGVEVTPSVGFAVYTPLAGPDAVSCIAGWRMWLYASNLLQFLPHVAMATTELLATGSLARFGAVGTAALPGDQAAADAAWGAVLGEVLETLRGPLAALAHAGLPLPSEAAGFELLEAGAVVAEAELVWEPQKVCLLPEHQFDYEDTWTARGWRVIRCEGDWASSLRVALTGDSADG